tara:strand:+ start:2166 stop:3932 length:1767 start_codon:yes stop_codon:yes gene_type:complete
MIKKKRKLQKKNRKSKNENAENVNLKNIKSNNKILFAPINKRLKSLYMEYKNNNKVIIKLKDHVSIKLPSLMKKWDVKDNLNKYNFVMGETNGKKENKKIEKEIVILPEIKNNKFNGICETNEINTEKSIPLLKETIILPNKSFLKKEAKNVYFLPNMNIYIKYENSNFSVIKYENIWKFLLKKIKTTDVGAKIKKNQKHELLKQIKNKTILDAIPNDMTINYILKAFTPLIFKNNFDIKYFLIILGDSILRKELDVIHYLQHSSINFIKYIMEETNKYFKKGVDIGRNIKYYIDINQNLDSLRIIKIQNIEKVSIWKPIIKYQILNIIIVSCFLSNKYKNSENYIKINQIYFNKNVIRLKGKSKEDIVNDFIVNEMKIISGIHESNKYNLEDLLFLWKYYLNEKGYPKNIIDYGFFGRCMIDRIPNERRKLFLHIGSTFLKSMKLFMEFWTDTCSEETENYFTNTEINNIYNMWASIRGYNNHIVSDTDILFTIKNYCPKVKILGNRLLNIKNNLWNKKGEMVDIINSYNQNYKNNKLKKYTIDEIGKFYTYYVDYSNSNTLLFLIRKWDFKNYVMYTTFKTKCVEL